MGFCGGQSGTVTGLSPSTLVFTCHYVSPKLHTHHNLTAILIISCKWSLGTLMATDFWMSESAGQKSTFTLLFESQASLQESVVNKVSMQQVFLTVLWFSISIIPPLLHTLIEQTHQLAQQQHTQYHSTNTSHTFIYNQDRYHQSLAVVVQRTHSHPTPITIKIPHNFSWDSMSVKKWEDKHWNPLQCEMPIWFQELMKYQ
jgi:hypothetical protein